ncbi:hypothetical protein PLEOSDRAFT_1113596 [Pleurotus ostreatus PC15]|uniref:Cytochrome P450 n=1 Tax=Pleurotus ostreatus (strain PC15) TaxID=1137138 RepID=A0A067NCX4_PLEO1|nr:hypothetical protein PLEOSDRAFT_1113596 [Pleurotus ostreatus PC15]
MSLLPLDPQSIAAIILCITALAVIHKHAQRPSDLPPGPRGHWLFGNVLPNAFAYRKFEEWTKEFGPVFSLRQGTRTIIVVGRVQAAMDIMEKEGAFLVDRPASIAAGETLSGGMRVLLTPAGERFKKLRRALHTHLQPKAVTTYSPVLMRNARNHILDLIDDPSNHQDHAKRYSASVVMALAYGHHPEGYDDPGVQAVNRCLTRLGLNLRPGLWKVDIYPFLRYIPGYLRELQDGHKEELALFKGQLATVREKMERDEASYCFGRYLLERQAELELDDNEVAYLAGALFGAGSDTTASAISITVMAAALHPEAQAKVQEELDSVIGSDRPPTMEDANMLPQTTAFVLETFRWRPVTAGGFAHKATKDIIWNNYRIPKGATVMGNIWAISRDPAVYPEPETFNPQRWLTEDGKLRTDMRTFSWGSGRRVCPGQYIAHSSVFLNAALMHWAFKISANPSSPIDSLAFTESANTHPLPFKVAFEPRTMDLVTLRSMFEMYGQ